MPSSRTVRRLLSGLAFVLFLGLTLRNVAQGRLSLLNVPAMLGACAVLLLLGVLTARGGLKAPDAPVPAAPVPPPGPPPGRSGGAAPEPARQATGAAPRPQPRFVPAPSAPPAPSPLFGPAPGAFAAHAAPSLAAGRLAPRELSPLRSTTVAALTSQRAEPEPERLPEPPPRDGEHRWGSPAAPGSATQVLPQRGRGRRRAVPVQAVPRQSLPPAAPVAAEPVAAEAVAAEPVAAPAAVAAPPPPAVAGAPRPTAAKVDLAPRPGDPTVGAALLGPARAKLHELEPPLVRSWLTLLDAGQRGEATPLLKAGQLAVLAAGLEDAAVRRRLLRAVADPFVDAVGLVTQDVPLDGLSAASAPAGRVGAARDLLLLVARTTTGTPAQGAAVRAVKWLDRPAG